MDIGGVVEAGMARPNIDVQQVIALRVVRDQMEEQKDLVAQVVNGPQQVASQVYDGHGQVVPTPAGSSVDARA
jgi:hypothetical protein